MNSTPTAPEIGKTVRETLRETSTFFAQPIRLFRGYKREDLRADLITGLTVSIVMLPGAIAYALVAELPPQMGLYASIIAAIVGALWGSSNHLNTGPTNTTSLIVLSGLLMVAVPGTPEYIVAAGAMAVWVGVIRLGLGLARLGILANFVSDAVIVGFTGGAGILIMLNQLKHIFRLDIDRHPLIYDTVFEVVRELGDAHWLSVAISVGTIVFLLLQRRFKPKWPGPLIVMVAGAAIVGFAHLDQRGVVVLGNLPRSLPPFTWQGVFDFELVRSMASSIFAVAIIGLVEATSISRAVASRSGQYLQTNQEFVGQGLANIASGLFSGYPCSGSMTRSVLNYEAGGRTRMTSVFGGLFVLSAMLLFAPLATFLPRAALSGLLVVMGSRMINFTEIRRIRATSLGDTLTMGITFASTLLLPLELAVFTGVLVSFARYIYTTSSPKVESMVPDKEFEHFEYQPDKPDCPQLGALTIEGSLYFGATQHVEDRLRANMNQHPDQQYLLLRLHRVNHCDISGLHMLETIVRLYRQKGGDVFVVGVREAVWHKMRLGGFSKMLGHRNFFAQERAIPIIFNLLDPTICIYKCPYRVWKECQRLPKIEGEADMPICAEWMKTAVIGHVQPEELWADIMDGTSTPSIIDIREMGEFMHSHIPRASLIPMPRILHGDVVLPKDEPIILICRAGRRTTQTICTLQQQGYDNLKNLEGGMVAWEKAGLPAVMGDFIDEDEENEMLGLD